MKRRMAALGPIAGVAWALPSMSREFISNFWPSSRESISALPKAGVVPTWMVFCDSEGEVMSDSCRYKLVGIGLMRVSIEIESGLGCREGRKKGYVTRSMDDEDEGEISVVGK